MKRVIVPIIVLFMLAPVWTSTEAAVYDTVVTGKGDPAVDVAAVQQALDKGGYRAFYSKLPADLPPAEPGPKVVIRNIHFQGALWTPVFLPYCSGRVGKLPTIE